MAHSALVGAHSARRVNTVTMEHPWIWLSEGWHDFTENPATSLAYGLMFTLAGWVLLFGLHLMDLGYLIVPLALGFALVGPAAAMGLYEISRRTEAGASSTLGDALSAWRRNPGQIALMGFMLLLALIAWTRFAMLLFMLFFGMNPPAPEMMVGQMLTSPMLVPFLLLGGASGAALAFGVFAMTAIAVPMLMDRDTDAMTAALTSLDAVRHNLRPMLLWAGLIALFTFAGLTLFFIGLGITLPLLGHASWHAYRDLVD